MPHRSKGFTLIELLVVIAIIGVLSSVVLSSLSTARAKGRDARRKLDLQEIARALSVYYINHGDFVQVGSGCAAGGNGNGWFNYENGVATSYPRSTAGCLIDDGIWTTEVIDPTGGRASSNPTNSIYTYMKYSCSSGTYIYAKLETLPQSDTAVDGTCSPTVDTLYGMNYYIMIK